MHSEDAEVLTGNQEISLSPSRQGLINTTANS